MLKTILIDTGPLAAVLTEVTHLLDFADATLVIVAERTGIKKIISIDSDFDIYRLPGKVRIENVFS